MADMPNLGYGKPTEATIDQVNQWMRGAPWYRDLLTSMGVNPDAPVKLSESQRSQVMKAAQAQGVVVDEGDMEVDPSGNFNPKGHKLRNTLIVAGVAAAAIAAPYAIGALSGGGGTAAGGAAAAGGVLPSTAIGTGMTGLTAGAVPIGMAGGAAIPGTVGAVSALAGAGSTASKVASLLKGAGNIGSAISAASSGAGNTRRADVDTNVGIHNSNVNAQAQFENELMNRAKQEQVQRQQALKDVARASYVQHPNVSPFNPVGAPKFSEAYLAALRNLEGQGSQKLSAGPQYDTNAMAPLAPIAPITPTAPGTMERIGGIVGPGLSVAKQVADIWGNW